MSDFYKTRMGQRFYERTMPDLVKQLDRIAERMPAGEPKVDELLLATYGLVNAVDEVFNAEIVPGSEATKRAFKNLRERADTARTAADGIR